MKFTSFRIEQSGITFYAFKCKASVLWAFSKINQRHEDKDEGYQRVLSTSRVAQIKTYLKEGNAIPGAIIISCDNARVRKNELTIPDKPDAAWIIDGQHRCAGAAEAAKDGHDIELPVIAFIDLNEEQQADYFVTINREAKGVPSSLYLDLLRHLPKKKTEKERLEERIADISRSLTRESDSVFFQRIVSTTSPKTGQISLTTFARRMRPLLHPNTGILGAHTLPEQTKIIENFFGALRLVFPRYFNKNIFFRTLGFGAIWRSFPLIFSATLREFSGFTLQDAAEVLRKVTPFDFDQWTKMGTGTAAETQAGDDLIQELKQALEADAPGSSIRL